VSAICTSLEKVISVAWLAPARHTSPLVIKDSKVLPFKPGL